MHCNNRSNTDNLLFIIQCYALKVPCISGNDPIDFICNFLVGEGKMKKTQRDKTLNLYASVHEKMDL